MGRHKKEKRKHEKKEPKPRSVKEPLEKSEPMQSKSDIPSPPSSTEEKLEFGEAPADEKKQLGGLEPDFYRCSKCKHQIPLKSQFCPYCGAVLDWEGV